MAVNQVPHQRIAQMCIRDRGFTDSASRQYGMSSEARTKVAEAFLQEIYNKGYTPDVYKRQDNVFSCDNFKFLFRMRIIPVSYTPLDVYKRQNLYFCSDSIITLLELCLQSVSAATSVLPGNYIVHILSLIHIYMFRRLIPVWTRSHTPSCHPPAVY